MAFTAKYLRLRDIIASPGHKGLRTLIYGLDNAFIFAVTFHLYFDATLFHFPLLALISDNIFAQRRLRQRHQEISYLLFSITSRALLDFFRNFSAYKFIG